jgi:hypothetical protein
MDRQSHKEQIGGATVHVADCYIWAAIRYLDSPTDYREYLPHGSRGAATSSGELLNTHKKDRSPWMTAFTIVLAALLASLVLLFNLWD